MDSRSGAVKKAPPRYPLDSAGIIMPAVADRFNTTFFRLSALLQEEVDAARLQRALDGLLTRFSHIFVRLVPTWSGHRLETLAAAPTVEVDEGFPCMGSDIAKAGTPLLRVRVKGRRLAVETSHVMTDGAGAVALFKAVLAEYVALAHPELGAAFAEAGIARPGDHIPPGEHEDAFRRYYQRGLRWPESRPRAWHIPGERLPRGEYRATVFCIDLAAVLSRTRSAGYRLTEFLAALSLAALQDLHRSRAGE